MVKRQHLVVFMAITALGLWEFAPALQAGFVYQDHKWLEAISEHRLGFGLRSLAMWTYTWGQSTVFQHALNLFLHWLVALGTLTICVGLGMRLWTALVAFAFVFLNPIQSEAVSYVTARTDLIATLAMVGLCGLLLYHRNFGPVQWLEVAIFCALAVGGKQIAVALFVLIPLMFLNWKLVMAGFAVLIVVCLYFTPGPVVGEHSWFTVSGRLHWLGVQSLASIRMMGGALSSWVYTNTVDYDYDTVAVWTRWASGFVLLGMTSVAVLVRKRVPYLAMSFTWVLAFIVPRLLVVTPNGYFNEHQFYGAMPGLAIAVSSLVMGDA